jgi:hypothetical protein
VSTPSSGPIHGPGDPTPHSICLHPLQSHSDYSCSLANEQPSHRSDTTATDHVHTIINPERFESLDDYLNIIRTNAIGKVSSGSNVPLPSFPTIPTNALNSPKLYIPRKDLYSSF